MDPTDEMCKSLIKWLQKISPNRSRNVMEICDGVAMLEALLQIIPEHFSKLEPKIKRDAGTNWRLRVSNLKKIVEAIVEYYQDTLGQQILEMGKPDVNKIGENNDSIQLAKLLRLILGCAIYCDRKQDYIELIMEMEESVQQNIMQAIQQLEEVTGCPGRSGLSLLVFDNEQKVHKLVADLEAISEAKEALGRQCQHLEQQIQNLTEENQQLHMQNRALMDKETRSPDTRKQIEILKDEIFKAEVIQDDLKAKLLEQEKQLLDYQQKITELQLQAQDSSRLKDEVDALTESAGKVKDLEQTVASYKKRLENYQDLKKQVTKLEEQNSEYHQKIMELEEEQSKSNNWRNQCETYKNQVVELQQKLDDELQKSDKSLFTIEKLESKLSALQSEKERLILERDSLREENDDLKLGKVKNEAANDVLKELTPQDLKERVRFLEKENKILKNSNQELEAKQSNLENNLSRLEKLQQQNRTLNQTIIKLEAQIEESKNCTEPSSPSSSNSVVKEYKQKIASLQESLTAKENELQIAQAKYQRNLEKAREVAQMLDSKSNSESPSHNVTKMKELEERLLSSAFYKLSLSLHREAMDERLAALTAGQGQSFLARQRQPTPRKQMQSKFKSK